MPVTQSRDHKRDFDAMFPAATVDLIQRYRPVALAALRNSYDEAYRATDPGLLELARLQIALMLDPAAARVAQSSSEVSEAKVHALTDWMASELFTSTERACLAFTEQFAFYVPDVSDELINDLLKEMAPDAVYGLILALYIVDAVERLRISLAAVFNDEGVR